MAGLINTEINKKDPLSSVAGYDPDKLTLDPKTDTVAGQIDTVIAKDNPLMQGARTRAAQTANSRGLINSSMAVQAGEEAVHNAALPIAQADAGINLRAKEVNQAAGNQAGQFNATTQSQAALQERTGQQAIERQQLQGTQETALTAQKGELEKGLQMLRGDQANQIAQVEAQYKQLMQSNDSASRLFSQVSASMGEILKEPNITPENKQVLIAKQVELLKSGMAVIGGISNLDLTSLLKFDSVIAPGAAPAPAPSPPAAPVTPPPAGGMGD